MTEFTSWVHGSEGQLEMRSGPEMVDRSTVEATFDHSNADCVLLGGDENGVAACIRLGWAARFVVFDRSGESASKSGHFWCHYAIPTVTWIDSEPSMKAASVHVNYQSTDLDSLKVTAIHMWDGNRRILRDEDVGYLADPKIGHTVDPEAQDAPGGYAHCHFKAREVHYGVCVSVYVRATRAHNDYIEIASVGVGFESSR